MFFFSFNNFSELDNRKRKFSDSLNTPDPFEPILKKPKEDVQMESEALNVTDLNDFSINEWINSMGNEHKSDFEEVIECGVPNPLDDMMQVTPSRIIFKF